MGSRSQGKFRGQILGPEAARNRQSHLTERPDRRRLFAAQKDLGFLCLEQKLFNRRAGKQKAANDAENKRNQYLRDFCGRSLRSWR